MRRIRIDWDAMIRSLVLVRLGQELGYDSPLARIVANTIDVSLAALSKILG